MHPTPEPCVGMSPDSLLQHQKRRGHALLDRAVGWVGGNHLDLSQDAWEPLATPSTWTDLGEATSGQATSRAVSSPESCKNTFS